MIALIASVAHAIATPLLVHVVAPLPPITVGSTPLPVEITKGPQDSLWTKLSAVASVVSAFAIVLSLWYAKTQIDERRRSERTRYTWELFHDGAVLEDVALANKVLQLTPSWKDARAVVQEALTSVAAPSAEATQLRERLERLVNNVGYIAHLWAHEMLDERLLMVRGAFWIVCAFYLFEKQILEQHAFTNDASTLRLARRALDVLRSDHPRVVARTPELQGYQISW